MGLLMGVDIGSTSVKAIVYDLRGNCISAGSSKIPLSYPDKDHTGWSVWEPDAVWNCVVASIGQALQGITTDGKVGSLAITGFGMDGLPVDEKGNPLYPFISWHCTRTLPQYEAFIQIINAEDLFRETGRRAMPIDSIYRMIWMRENHPEILEKTYKWLLIEDYINFKLCGQIATDYSMGSTTSAYKPDTHSWSTKILQLAGISGSLFPPLCQSGSVLGEVLPEVCAKTGLKRGTMVALGGHDYISSAFALGVVDERSIMDITGTWEILVAGCRNLSLSGPTMKGYIEGHVVKNAFCKCISNVSGDMAEWFKKNFASEEEARSAIEAKTVWELLMEGADRSPVGSLGCTFLPHFSGCNAPNCEPASLGAYVGLHNRVGKADMMRATLEGLSYKMREMMEAISGEGQLPEQIIAAGGAVQNHEWMQMKADVTGIAIEVPDLYETTALGAAMLAGVGIGYYADEEEAMRSVRRNGVVYQPDRKKHEKYSDLYQNIYLPLQKSLSGVNAEIHKRFIQNQ